MVETGASPAGFTVCKRTALKFDHGPHYYNGQLNSWYTTHQ